MIHHAVKVKRATKSTEGASVIQLWDTKKFAGWGEVWSCLSNSSFSNGGKVGKGACDNPERFCVVLRSIKFLKEFLENGTRDHRSMFASCVPGTVYWSYPILPFGTVASTFFFRQPSSKVKVINMRYWPSVRSRWLGFGQVLFCVLFTETKWRSIKNAKKNRPIYSHKTERAWSIIYPQVANQNEGFPFILRKQKKRTNT